MVLLTGSVLLEPYAQSSALAGPSCSHGENNQAYWSDYGWPGTPPEPETYEGATASYITPPVPYVCTPHSGTDGFSNGYDGIFDNHGDIVQAGMISFPAAGGGSGHLTSCPFQVWGELHFTTVGENVRLWKGTCLVTGSSHHIYVETIKNPTQKYARAVTDGSVIFTSTHTLSAGMTTPIHAVYSEEVWDDASTIPGQPGAPMEMQHMQTQNSQTDGWEGTCTSIYLQKSLRYAPVDANYGTGADDCDHLIWWDTRNPIS
jgi:hypothetical protein